METSHAGPPDVHRARVAEGWIDYNGQANRSYCGVAFGDASDAYLPRGFHDAYRRDVGGTFYMVETHFLPHVGLEDVAVISLRSDP